MDQLETKSSTGILNDDDLDKQSTPAVISQRKSSSPAKKQSMDRETLSTQVNDMQTSQELLMDSRSPTAIGMNELTNSFMKSNSNLMSNLDEELDNSIRLRKLSSPLIKTVMAETKQEDTEEKFGITNWAEFQDILKSNHFVIKQETSSKAEIKDEIDKLILDYNSLHLRIRHNNEKIRKKLNKEDVKDEELAKVILDEKNRGLSDAVIFIKNLLYLLFKEPRIFANLVRNNDDAKQLKALEETLCTTFYEDIIADEVYDDDLIRLLAELLEMEFEKAKKYNDLLHTEHFTNKMLTSYLKRNECKRYVKSILKNPLVSCIKVTGKIKLDPKEIQKQIDRRKEKRKEAEQKARKTGSSLKDMFFGSKKAEPEMRRQTSSLRVEEYEEMKYPKFQSRRFKQHSTSDNNDSGKKSNEETKSTDLTHNGSSSEHDSPLSKIENQDVVNALHRNFRILKKHLTMIIQSIFDNLYSMPIGLRILCKILHMLAKKKFNNLTDKESKEILANYLLRKWICPNFIFPEHNGIVDDFQATDEIQANLMEIAKVMQMIFTQTLYAPEDHKSELNPFIKAIIPSVSEYFDEVIAVNEELVESIRSGVARTNRIKSRSICISLQEIQLLYQRILKQREEISVISTEAVKLAEKIEFYDTREKIFNDKIDPASKMKLSPSQAFVLFYELIFPEDLVSEYLGEFNKMIGFKKDLPEDKKILCRAKHLLKQLLLNIEDIKNMKRLSADGNLQLDDVLEKYQDKLYSYESKHATRKEKTPVHISARFLLSILRQLDKSYSENNYRKLYLEMLTDFKKLASHLDFSISSTKLQLLKALDTLHRNCSALYEVNEKKQKAIKKTYIREFIKTVKIPLCITSPSTMKNLGAQPQSKKKDQKSSTMSDKIETTVRDEKGCIHERFAIIRELAANGGVLGGVGPRSHSKSVSSNSSDDIFNESNYHCDTIDEFINIFGSLPEVKEAIIDGQDKHGVSEGITFYYNRIHACVKNKFRNVEDDEYDLIMNEIENYICKRLYTRVFPAAESPADNNFWKRCKVLEWVTFDHLEIIQRNRCQEMWNYAANVMNQIDNRLTPLEKLECMVECFKIITQVLELASTKEGSGGADVTLPIMIYVLLKACPRRIHSNLNFIQFLRDSEKMLAGEGYCFTQVRSAVIGVEQIDHSFFKMPKEEYDAIIHKKELEYQILLK